MNAFRCAHLATASLLLLGCADKPEPIDADLARDIALASEAQQQSLLVPEDTALSREPVRRPLTETTTKTPTRTASAPARRPAPAPPVAREPQPRVEQPRPVEREPEPAPAPAPAAARMRGFLAGTSFGLTTKGQVCTNGSRVGDKIVATLDAPISGENGASLPAGTSVVLEVTSITPGDTPESATIMFRLRSIIIEGEARSVDADVSVVSELSRTQVARDEGSDRKKVIGGAIAGAIIGQVMGKDTKSTVIGAAAGAGAGAAAAAASRKYDACLPAGSQVRVTTTQPLHVAA